MNDGKREGELIIDRTGQRKIHNNKHENTFPFIILQEGDFKCKEKSFYEISSRLTIMMLNVYLALITNLTTRTTERKLMENS